ncbi:DUF4097 family beta strand repeat-containing protein [Halosimplex sp. TS25]|uniref:DUF4097 family beta strand repeat-containing protein n=1 Tax=Halosimplex rarum TaxID=3396619 RepID=UPI0039E84F90
MVSPPTQRPSRRRFLRAGGGLAAAFGLAGCVISMEPYTETVDRSFDSGDAEELVVQTDSGDVSLTASDGDAVSGTIRKESRSGEDALDRVTVEGRVEDGTLTIAPQRPNPRVNVTVSLDLAIPEGLPVAEVASENGDVSADGVTGDGTYRSSNGDVDVESVDGFVAVESTNGDVSASEVGGLDGAQTSNGDVTVDVPALRGDVTCRSSNGDVTAAVPEDLRAAVSLRTSNGDAEVSGVSLTVDESTERRIEGRLDGSGDGGDDGSAEHTLELRSTNGDVTLLRL